MSEASWSLFIYKEIKIFKLNEIDRYSDVKFIKSNFKIMESIYNDDIMHKPLGCQFWSLGSSSWAAVLELHNASYTIASTVNHLLLNNIWGIGILTS